jgi:hypothetical protein
MIEVVFDLDSQPYRLHVKLEGEDAWQIAIKTKDKFLQAFAIGRLLGHTAQEVLDAVFFPSNKVEASKDRIRVMPVDVWLEKVAD